MATRLRFVCDIATGSGDTQDAEPEGEYHFYVRSPHPLRSTGFTFDTEAVLTAGDGAVGEVFHHVRGKFHAHQRVYVLSNFRHILPRYFYYYFSSFFRLMAQDGSARTTVDSVRRWMLTDMPFVLPPLDEQRAIADYLDNETAQIDALVAKQEGFIGLLRERQEAFADAEFQQRGDRRSATVRQTLVRLDRSPLPGSGVVTAYRDGVVTLRANRRADGYTMSEAEAGYQGVLPGDIVFHALDGFAGAVGISDSEGQCSPVYHVCRPRYADDAEYLALLIRYMGTSGFLSTQAPSTRQRSVDFRNWGTFARVPLVLPTVDHQKKFVAEYQAHSARFDGLIAKAQEHIALAKERRSALITAAVTGQIDVRTARMAG
ncbi:restriction endonuclease subunit S [Actinomadura sp. CNU-125]|uniref:restriction endonuclease subunit S n=1 Tax=Actinomadura sp. CNU-125 TaxID=1904961 RepID=UPI001300D3ED|nr:restriction endonuclease subunit S [Actinomadura sp. CNU-125]